METGKRDPDTNILASYLQRSIHDDKPVKLLEATVSAGCKSGQNYGSDVRRVKFKFITASGKRRTRCMIVKLERDWSELTEHMSKFPLFRVEVKVYTGLLALMEELMEEFEDKREKLWPTMYGFQPYNLIAFEDVNESRHTVPDRKKSLNLNESLLVLRELGRFHAMSKVLIQRGLLTNEEKGSYFHVEEGGVIWVMWQSLLTAFSDGIRKTWGSEWCDLSERLGKMAGLAALKMQKLATTFDPRFEVVCHGDLWTCNIMIRYLEYENTPVSVKFLDFQCAFGSSYIWDVVNLLMNSVSPAVRRENENKLLEAYHESFEKNLKFFDYTGYIPTMEDVRSEWTRTEFFQLMAVCIHVITSANGSNVFLLDKVMDLPPNEVFKESAFTDGKAKENIAEDLQYFYDKGVF